ncbi:MAG: YihY/virulence factor BrkB family protein [Terriglobales bacterium]|jgi:membrane protein
MGGTEGGTYALTRVKTLLRCTYISCLQHNQLNNAAALSFFFLLSLSPLLIFLVSLMALLPIHNLDSHILDAMSQILPVDATKVVARQLRSVFESNRSLLSLEILGAIWAGSTGFYALIMALNTAYLAKESRSLWQRQVVSIGLTIVVGAMVFNALSLSLLGTRIGSWLAARWGMNAELAVAWPYIRWLVAVGFIFLSVALLYFIAPNVKHRLVDQVPGVTVAVILWLASSFVLGWYLRISFSAFAAIYGTLGAVIALMLWFYLSSLAILIGAEVNAQIRLMRVAPHP